MGPRQPVSGTTTRLPRPGDAAPGPGRAASTYHPAARRRSRALLLHPMLITAGLTLILITCQTILRPRAPRPGSSSASIAPLLQAASPAGCDAGASKRARLLLGEGLWEQAEAAASEALAQGRTCPGVAAALEAIRRAAAIELLLATQAAPSDIERQAALAAQYWSLRQRGAPSVGLTDLQAARRAYHLQLFAVARAAFESSLEQDTFPRDNLALVQQYASTLYNLAHWNIQTPTPDPIQAGQLAAASYCIERAFGLPYAASEDLLRRLAGDDPGQWPGPVDTPLLEGALCAEP